MIIHKSPLNSCFYSIIFPYFSITFHDFYLCTGCYYLVLLVFDMITWLLYCFDLDFRFCFNSIILLLLSSFIFVLFSILFLLYFHFIIVIIIFYFFCVFSYHFCYSFVYFYFFKTFFTCTYHILDDQ